VRFHADLHIHSKYSRACSRDCDLEHLAWWAARKGISVVGTGDFTHPAWADELRTKLVPAEPGLYRLCDEIEQAVLRRLPPACRTPVRFLLSTEISTIYKRGDRTRKVHHLLYAPDLDAVAEITRRLARIGNLTADGRPILGLDSRDLLEVTLEGGEGCYLVPAHVWTPWFAALGSKSGFDSIEECYADLAGHIFALETGLSSDPPMNWRVSCLDRFQLVSNSDAHSPPMIGREATVFDTALDYFAIKETLETGAGHAGTVEFFPEEGKYHLDGHRKCGVRLDPLETRGLDGRCPACAKPLTVGVLHRVDVLADREEGQPPPGAVGFRCLVQLPQVVGEILGVGPKSKSVVAQIDALVARFGPELAILDRLPLEALAEAGSPILVEAIDRLRNGRVVRDAGYDGEYGVIRLFEPKELDDLTGTGTLFDLATPAAVKPKANRRQRAAETEQVDAALGPTSASAPPPAPPPLMATGTRGSILDGLDPDQRAAASVAGGPLLIVAGPGTGKTRTVTHLIAHRVRELGVAPDRCLALTFTRRAAGEMRERLLALAPDQANRVLASTFHGLGLRIVREQHAPLGIPADVRVADDALRATVLRDALALSGDVRRVGAEISERKRRAERTAELDRYDAALRERGLVDLDDLITLPVQLLTAEPALAAGYRDRWSCICVDEYQDIDELQYRLLRLLSRPDGDLCAIGDPDQAIYGFRGADVGFFLRFRTDFPSARVVQLTRNYRSTPTIVQAALRAIALTTLVPGRRLTAVASEVDGPIVVRRAPTESDEAGIVVESIDQLLGGSSFHALDSGTADASRDSRLSFADFAVLYRTDAQSGAIAEALGRKGFPFQKRSHDRLARQPGVQAVLRALREQADGGPRRPVLGRVRDAVQRALDAAGDDAEVATVRAAVDLLAPLATDCGIDLERFFTDLAMGAEVDAWDPRADRISLLTLHAAKGLEFPVVFVVGCEDGLLPLRWPGAAIEAADEAEERRLFFVGMTRATTHLVLTHAGRRSWAGTTRDTQPSSFLAQLPEALLDRSTGAAAARSRRPRQLRLV
jgi:superfamily I DNA/RNA helicase/PHP family Zn ribbon phosphoesterase